MLLPVWQTPSGLLGTLIERKTTSTTVIAEGDAISYSVISGTLPTGLYLNSNTGQIIGTTTSVSIDTTVKFVIRASNDAGVADRTFFYNISGPSEPVWATPAGSLPAGINGEYFTINKEWVDYSLRANIDILQDGNSLKYYIADQDGQLPPGLTLSQAGRISGYIDDTMGVDIFSSITGGYDLDSYDMYSYDHSTIDFRNADPTNFTDYFPISNISNSNPCNVTISDTSTILNKSKIWIDNVVNENTSTSFINKQYYYVGIVNSTTLQLFENETFTTPVDSTQSTFGVYKNGGYVYYGSYSLNQAKTLKKIYQFYVTVTDGIFSSKQLFSISVVDHSSLRIDTSTLSIDSNLVDISSSYILSPIWQSKDGNKLPKVSNLGSIRAGKNVIIETYNYNPDSVNGLLFYDWNTVKVNPDILLVSNGNVTVNNIQTSNLQGHSIVYYDNAEITPVTGMAICFGDTIPNTDNSIYVITNVIPTSKKSGTIYLNQPLAYLIPDSKLFYVGTLNQHPTGLHFEPNTGKLYGIIPNIPSFNQQYRFTLSIIKIDQSVGNTSLFDAIGSTHARIINKIYTTLTNEPPEGITGLIPASSYTGNIGDIWLVGKTVTPDPQFIEQNINFANRLPFMNGTLRAYVFTGQQWAFIGESVSKNQIFLLTVLGNAISNIEFVSSSSLGTLEIGQISELSVKAVNIGTNYSIEYEIVQGQLPTGLTFNNDGTIQGMISNSGQTYFDFQTTNTTFDTDHTSIDKNWYFTVRANDVYRLNSNEKQFYISSYRTSTTNFTKIYLRPFLSVEQRATYRNFITDSTIFDPSLLYRPLDSEFGIQQQIKLIIETGIEEVLLDQFASAMNFYFHRKKFYFGNVKSISAQDQNRNYVYDLIYVEIIDDTMNGAFSPNDASSVNNMQKQLTSIVLTDQSTILINEQLQPRYMTTVNTNTGVEIGFIKAVPLCFTVPNGSSKILEKINNAISNKLFNFNQFNFDTDRIIIEKPYSTQSDWILYPTTQF